jgi:hypothetical protein
MIVKFAAQLIKVNSRADKSYALTFITRELTGKDASTLLDELLNEGHLLYSPNDDIEFKDIPKEPAETGLNNKTPSQRLRAVLFVRWEQLGKKGSFDDFYKRNMEQLIDVVKSKLE